MNCIDYVVLESHTLTELEVAVNGKLCHGFIPVGSITVIPHSCSSKGAYWTEYSYCQAVAKYDTPPIYEDKP
jgi:hypothetical protein